MINKNKLSIINLMNILKVYIIITLKNYKKFGIIKIWLKFYQLMLMKSLFNSKIYMMIFRILNNLAYLLEENKLEKAF